MAERDDMAHAFAWTEDLTEEQRHRVRTAMIERKLSAGEYLCRQGEPSDYWIGVISGIVKMSVSTATGEITTLTKVAAGGWFGEGSVLKGESRRYDCLAISDTRIALIPRAAFLWLLDNSIPFNRFVMTLLNERLANSFAIIECSRLQGPDARVARCLATLFNPVLNPSRDERLELSQEEIALLSGMSRQRVNRALHKLEEARLLKLEHRRIIVLDVAGLRSYGA